MTTEPCPDCRDNENAARTLGWNGLPDEHPDAHGDAVDWMRREIVELRATLAYQRGNRDGLLSFAATCEARAHAEDEEGDHLAKHRTMGERLSVNRYHAAAAWMDAARLARVAAEALPEDPTPQPPSP